MKKTYYKVVRRSCFDIKLVSCTIEPGIEYIPGQFVFSKNVGRLCVFDSKQKAINFIHSNTQEVWECEIGKVYPNSRIPNYNIPFIQLFGKRNPSNDENQGYFRNLDSYMLMLAKIIKAKKKFSHLLYKNSEFPSGTIFTDKVKLVKKAYPRSY